MDQKPLTMVRKALLWWFRWPANPYVTITAAIDFSRARAYLEQLKAQGPVEVTIHHLVLAAVARVLKTFPEANAHIIGGHVERQPHVGVLMPVNLLGHAAGARQEVGLGLVAEVEDLTLRQVAAACRQAVHAERSGRPPNVLIRTISRVVERLPYRGLGIGLDLLNRLKDMPFAAHLLYRQLPFTTALSNAGAPFGDMPEGMLFRSVAFGLPQRLIHIGTVWGISAVQNEVLAIAGQPAVRPVLPVALIFDHRLFDGVKAGQILLHFAGILRDPEAVFGPDGQLSHHTEVGGKPSC